MTRAPWLAFAVALALVPAPPAWAGDADEAASTELFNAGRDLMKRGDYAAACPKLAESARLRPTVGALAKLGECEEHEKRLVSAYTRWQQALNLARSRSDDRLAAVEREAARLDRLVPKLRIDVAQALPAGAEIRVDDVVLGVAGVSVPLAVEPGQHIVRASAPQKKTWSTTLETAPDGATTSVVIPPLEDAPASAPAPAPASALSAAPTAPPTAPVLRTNPWRTVGFATTVAGVAALAAGGAFGLDAVRRRNDANCSGLVCADSGRAKTLQDAKTSADWSTALFAAGGVLVAGGVTMWIVARDSRSTVRVGVLPTLGGGVVAGSWETR